MGSSVNNPVPVRVINWKKNLFFLWLSQILALAGFAAVIPFIPIFFRQYYGIESDEALGLWVSALTFIGMSGFCLATPLWGILSDKFGRKLMLLRSYYVTAFLFPLLYFCPNVFMFIFIRFLVSSFSGTTTAAQTLIVTNTPEEKHGFALGTLSTAFWSGNMVGFLIGALIVNSFGFMWAFIICGLMYLAGGIMVHLWVDERFVREEAVKAEKKLPKVKVRYSAVIWGILLMFLLMGMARRIDEPFIAILVEEIGGREKAVYYTGIICAIAALGGFLSGVVIGKMCDRFDPRKIAVPALLVSALTMFFQAMAGSLAFFGGARFVNFLAAGGLEPAFQTMLSRLSPPEKRGTLFGLSSSIRMVGTVVASLLGGAVIWFGSIRAVFFTGGVLFLILILVMLMIPKEKKGDVK